MAATVLFVVPNSKKFGDQKKDCGWYLPTVCFAYNKFIDAGLKVTICSPFGGNSPVDPESKDLWDYTLCTDFLYDRPVMALLQNTVAIKDVDPSQFQAVYFAGGFASMYDFQHNEKIKEVTAKIYENGGVVSSVGMGAAALLNVKLANGSCLIGGKKLTAFTNVELDRSGNAFLMPYRLETRLKEQGADFQEGTPRRVNVVEDQRLVTGQNCTSTAETAQAIIKCLEAHNLIAKKGANFKALIVLTNTSVLGDGKASGWYLPTVSYPYKDLVDEGVSVTFCSPYGGHSIVDDESEGLWDHPENRAFMNDKAVMEQIKNTVPVKNIDPTQYHIIHFGGGFGAIYDLADNEVLNKITAQIYENGGIVSSISNGGAGLLNVKLSNGKYLVQDKHVTAITDEELSRLPECESVPFKVQSRLIAQGANFTEGTAVKENVVVSDCGRIVTGQNPNSSIDTAHSLVKACKELKASA